MVLCAWSMGLGLSIAVLVLFERSVKKPPRRRSHGKSVPCSGLSKPLQEFLLHPLPCSLLTQSFGEIGRAVNYAVDGWVCFGHKPSTSLSALQKVKRRE